MKSVFRSAFEPVPRCLSARAQALVVGLLMVGVAVSVFEYLESSSRSRLPPRTTQTLPATPAYEGWIARPRTGQLRASSLVPGATNGTVPGSCAGGSSAPAAASSAPLSCDPGSGG